MTTTSGFPMQGGEKEQAAPGPVLEVRARHRGHGASSWGTEPVADARSAVWFELDPRDAAPDTPLPAATR